MRARPSGLSKKSITPGNTFLIRPEMVFIPKILNVIAAIVVIVLLIYQWLPKEESEKHIFKDLIKKRTIELTKSNENLQKEIKKHKLTAKNLISRTTQLSGTVLQLEKEAADRRLAEKALGESEKFLKIIYEAAENVAFVLTDISGKDTRILDISPGAEKMFQCTRDEVIGEKISLFHLPEDVEKFPKMQAKLSEKKTGYSDEATLVRKSGEHFPALFTIYPRFDENGNIDGTLGVSIDITKRKQKKERYKKTIDSSIDGFWIVDTKGDFLEVNEAYCKMIGYNRSQLLKMSISDVEVVEQPEETRERIKKIIKQGNDRFESKHRHKNGNIIEIEVSTTYTPDKDGMFFVFLRDITDKKQVEAQLKQAQKMESIGNLAGGIAHDFNNLLCPIIGMSEMLLEDLPLDSLEHGNAQEIFDAGRRAEDLVKQILAFSRKSEFKKISIRIQQVLKEVVKLTTATIPSDIQITHDIQSDCGRVLADPTQIHQIAMNLITNAYHAVEKMSGKIELRLKEITVESGLLKKSSLVAGKYARLTVRDNGVGMDPCILDKIFEPYFTTKEKEKGTGLGLAVVYGIVQEHNGEIKVSSKLGSGTTFDVYLPLMSESTEALSFDIVSDLEKGTERILFVDDEAPVARLGKKMLQRLGYKVTAFTNSMDALEAFRGNPDSFDIVITDMTMPNMTGDLFAKELMKIKPVIPIIICTGFSERMNPEKAEEIGIKGILMKPIVRGEMAHMVRKVLDGLKE